MLQNQMQGQSLNTQSNLDLGRVRNETQDDDLSGTDSIPEEAVQDLSESNTISSKPFVPIKQKVPMNDICSVGSSIKPKKSKAYKKFIA